MKTTFYELFLIKCTSDFLYKENVISRTCTCIVFTIKKCTLKRLVSKLELLLRLQKSVILPKSLFMENEPP